MGTGRAPLALNGFKHFEALKPRISSVSAMKTIINHPKECVSTLEPALLEAGKGSVKALIHYKDTMIGIGTNNKRLRLDFHIDLFLFFCFFFSLESHIHIEYTVYMVFCYCYEFISILSSSPLAHPPRRRGSSCRASP